MHRPPIDLGPPMFCVKNPWDLPNAPPTCCLVLEAGDDVATILNNSDRRLVLRDGDSVKLFRLAESLIPTLYTVAIAPAPPYTITLVPV